MNDECLVPAPLLLRSLRTAATEPHAAWAPGRHRLGSKQQPAFSPSLGYCDQTAGPVFFVS